MKRIIVLIFCLLSAFAQAEISNPTKWTFTLSSKEIHVGDTVEIIATAEIIPEWYIYSNDFDPTLGPILTEFEFTADNGYRLLGKTKAIKPKKKHDPIWDGEVTYFVGHGEFRQKIVVLNNSPKISFSVTYQTCSEGSCIPGEAEFEFSGLNILPARPIKKATGLVKTVLPDKPTDSSKIVEPNETTVIDSAQVSSSADIALKDRGNNNEETSLWLFAFFAFIGGLISIVTPCVFPMVPMTVSFFTNTSTSKKESVRKAIIYGLSIIAIYSLVGILISKISGPEFASFLSTHWIPNLLFTLIFIVFALSFFGLFEITLPNSFINKIDKQSDKGGYAGLFFMAFTIVLVSFSCTGPIVSTILLEASRGELIKPTIGMVAYSTAFALPFTLFALFPNWLKSLPKSGGWLNTVKVSLGFIELALAMKFLIVVDQDFDLYILTRPVFLTIWILIFVTMAAYLSGVIKFSKHDHGPVGKFRIALSALLIVFVIYLSSGLGFSLKEISGYIPAPSRKNNNYDKLCNKPKYSDSLHLPFEELQGYFDYKEALACAKKQGKPLFIDFTGIGCVNCREMENYVWSDPAVLKSLSQDFVMVSLYCDKRLLLPENEWYTSPRDNKVKNTMAKQNTDFQIQRFNSNALPLYVIIDPYSENKLTEPIPYNKDIPAYLDFLKEGKSNYKKLHQ